MRVEPDGPQPCDLMLVGEAPGHDEMQEGRNFVGKAGVQLWSELKRITGLTRAQFRVVNLIPYGLPKNRNPKPAEVSEAMPEFLTELEHTRPRLVVTAGGFSTRAVLGDWAKVHNVHGLLYDVELAGMQFQCLPIYHPAAGLHQKGLLAPFAWDLERLGRAVRGDLLPWKPTPFPPTSKWLTEPIQPHAGLAGHIVGVDTEGWPENPWGLSYSVDGVTGYVIPAKNRALLKWFAWWLLEQFPVLHNGLHDIPVLRALGVDLPAMWHDTQVLAYHEMLRSGSGALEAESQNLGTLAYRELGMTLGELTDIPGVNLSEKHIPISDTVMQYAGEDAAATRRLFIRYQDLTDDPCYLIDMGQIPLVEEMVATGLPVDREAVFDYLVELTDKEADISAELQVMAKRRGKTNFNPRSHLQVRELITRSFGLRPRKRTKGGKASTNEKALAEFQHHPFVAKLQEHREVVKLIGTYVRPLYTESV